MNCTIIADASFCSGSRASGYGFFLRSDRNGSVYGGGTFSKKPKNSTTAELWAYVNSVYQALKLGFVRKGDHIVLQGDNQTQLTKLGWNGSKITCKELKYVLAKYELSIDVRYVPSSTGNARRKSGEKSKRTFVHDRVDQIAYRYMSKQRKVIKLRELKKEHLGE